LKRRQLTMRAAETGAAVAIAILALLIGLLFVAAAGASVSGAISALWQGAFGSSASVAGVITKIVPLTLVALGWIVVFRAGRFHVGFPGQIMLGGIFSAFIGLHLHTLPHAVHLPLAILAGVLGGIVMAAIAAWLWVSRGVNEILSTLLLNLIVFQILDWLVSGPMKVPGGVIPATAPLDPDAVWPFAWVGTLGWDVVYIPIAVVGIAFLLSRTRFGFRISLVGANERFARTVGVEIGRIGVGAIVLSGALAGLAGSSLILTGENTGMTGDFEGSYGFDGIAVALLARNSPWGVLPAALLFAVLRQGANLLEANLGVSTAAIDVTQGLIILLVLGATTVFYRISKRFALPPTGGGTMESVAHAPVIGVQTESPAL
jgi:simple sugar transport system permease protein